MLDQPRSLKDPAVLRDRLSRLHEPHVATLNTWVEALRSRLGPAAIVPWFDPADAGVNAKILWLLEAPGGKATTERAGSGIISCNNDDPAAVNTWQSRVDAGVDRRLVAHWNVIPYYLGDATKIRAWEPDDVAAAGPLTGELLELLPELKVIILGGKAAQESWELHGPFGFTGKVLACPHPGARNWNSRPDTGPRIRSTWATAGRAAQPAADLP